MKLTFYKQKLFSVSIREESKVDFSQQMKYLIPERAQVLAGLQDALDDGHRVCQSLHLLQ